MPAPVRLATAAPPTCSPAAEAKTAPPLRTAPTHVDAVPAGRPGTVSDGADRRRA
ncbi:hypothetical protein [Dactylosporangium matsuzakiense]|uniref:hypothetical protein n=1 Tax=Dactylosporangium matsuzakiense TaxID=53360 RepID=UPI0021C435F2|nr:hypothetical protein [Dactylosporangium matsuzakiense]UWZ44371.1 hypothetical protein Dmats_44580 [Dactylosporangium matsuzakiense]